MTHKPVRELLRIAENMPHTPDLYVVYNVCTCSVEALPVEHISQYHVVLRGLWDRSRLSGNQRLITDIYMQIHAVADSIQSAERKNKKKMHMTTCAEAGDVLHI
jgi:hypothetical protein